MYKIVGADGKEYGPVSLDQMRQWIGQGRVNAQTRVQAEGSTEWRSAAEIPELSDLLKSTPTRISPGPMGSPPAAAPAGVGSAPQPRQGLAITSFVLGLLSILCFGLLTGIPAIITGHSAHGRARRDPTRYGGTGFAVAGFVMGYVSILLTLLALAILLPALAKAKAKSTEVRCTNNLHQIGAALQMFAMDHNDKFPFSVDSSSGGTLEAAKTDANGFAADPSIHFKALSEQLDSAGPSVLVCPADKQRSAAGSFDALQSGNITYQLRAVPGIETNLDEAVVVCPIHKNKLMPDGSVKPE